MLRGVLAWVRELDPELIAIEDNDTHGCTDPRPRRRRDPDLTMIDDDTTGGAQRRVRQHLSGYISQDGHGRKAREGGYTPGAGWLITELKKEYKVREVPRRNICELELNRGTNAARVIRKRGLDLIGAASAP